MARSLSYSLVKTVLNLKGIKKTFSQDPIHVQKIRREDALQPKGLFYKKRITRRFPVLKSTITEIRDSSSSKPLILYIHGGAFISGPAQHHWDSLKKIIRETGYDVWMCDYPKAPEHQIEEISTNIDAVYQKAIQAYSPDEVYLIGDSAGGCLITTLIQRLIHSKKPIPKKAILISPVMDCSMQHKDIADIDPKDIMLSTRGILSAKKMCAGSLPLDHPLMSPLYGNFSGFPETLIFAAENDIMYPDEILAAEKMSDSGTKVKVIHGEGMPHIWPLLPIMKESKIALSQLISFLR